MVRIFVYGSLKRGFKQHERHMKGARFIADTQTADANYHLVAITEPELDFVYPAMIIGGAFHIQGEVFEIDPSHLTRLDEYEGECYQRKELLLQDQSTAFAYVYDDCPSCNFLEEHEQIVTKAPIQSWRSR